MDCLNCGSEMEEAYKKIHFHHPFGKKKNTLKQKTKRCRVWHCKKCNKYYALTTTLTEAEVVD